MSERTIAFIGFGEAANAIASGWEHTDARSIKAFDIKTDDPRSAATQWARYKEAGVTGCATLAEALGCADLVFSLVTADQAEGVAKEAAEWLPPGALYLDGNSCAPSAKQEGGKAVQAAGARFVDLAIMAPIHPHKHKTPMLVSGPHESAARAALQPLAMPPQTAGAAIGDASTIKMLRSIMVKGMEALFAEMALAAHTAGVTHEVLASLQASTPALDWEATAAYALDRMLVHGTRRAAEMEEVSKTVSELGITPRMATETAKWQELLGAVGLPMDDSNADRRLTTLLTHLSGELADAIALENGG